MDVCWGLLLLHIVIYYNRLRGIRADDWLGQVLRRFDESVDAKGSSAAVKMAPCSLRMYSQSVVEYHASEVYDGLGYSRRRNESQSIIISEVTPCSAAGTLGAATDKTACEFSVET